MGAEWDMPGWIVLIPGFLRLSGGLRGRTEQPLNGRGEGAWRGGRPVAGHDAALAINKELREVPLDAACGKRSEEARLLLF